MSKWTHETWEEASGGYQQEYYFTSAIRQHLLTDEQRKELIRLGLSIEDCLNGRYTSDCAQFISSMYKDWNEKLGWREFLD